MAQPLPESRGPETVAIPMTAASVGSFDPETAFFPPVADDPEASAEHTSSAPPSGPETTVIPAVVPPPPPVGDQTTPPTPPAAAPNPRRGNGAPDADRGRRRGGGPHRPGHTLADDIFELGDDDE